MVAADQPEMVSAAHDGADPVAELARLLRARNLLDETLTALIGRPSSPGNIGEFIAAKVFGIRLADSGTNPGFDGVFEAGKYAGFRVNVKLYSRDDGLLDVSAQPVDLYLVLRGPRLAEAGRRRALVVQIERAYILSQDEVLAALAATGARVGVASSLRREVWDRAQVFPPLLTSRYPLTAAQVSALAQFSSSGSQLLHSAQSTSGTTAVGDLAR